MPKVSKIALRLDEVALPASSVAQLRKVAPEGGGTVILTAPPGAHRAQAAEAVARKVGRDLVRVDLSQVVSRFIGETEKNVDALFAGAAASGAVLLFDEADALFGKRSGVKDSHDRYANVDIGYLLQKIEAHSGVVVLASSGRQNLDPAFLRRLRHVVDLPWPPKAG